MVEKHQCGGEALMWWRSTDVVEKLLYGGISHMW